MKNSYVTVLGGMNADIIGTPYKRPIMNDSNPGKITVTAGGVARNIAENIAKLGICSKMMSAVGDDSFGRFLIDSCKGSGVDTQDILISDKYATSIYLCMNDNRGDMQYAVNDMDIMSLITPDFVSTKIDTINNGSALVIDANLSEETLEYLKDNVTVPIFADSVSENKAHKFLPVMSMINTIKVNLLEAELLSGMKITSFKDAKDSAFEIQRRGIKNVYLTMGGNGVVYCGDFEAGMLPCYKSEVVSTTGCGDAFMSALVFGYLNGYSAKKSAKAGLASASVCISSKDTVSNEISSQKIIEIMEGTNNAKM